LPTCVVFENMVDYSVAFQESSVLKGLHSSYTDFWNTGC